MLIGGNRSVVGIVDVGNQEAGLVEAERRFVGFRRIRGCPGQLRAKETDRMHGVGLAAALARWFVVAIGATMLAAAHVVQKLHHSFAGLFRDRETRHLRARQRHHEPTRHGKIPFVAGLVSPAALLMLRLDDEIDRRQRPRAEFRILRHPVGLDQARAMRSRGHTSHCFDGFGPRRSPVAAFCWLNNHFRPRATVSLVAAVDVVPLAATVVSQQRESRWPRSHARLSAIAPRSQRPSSDCFEAR